MKPDKIPGGHSCGADCWLRTYRTGAEPDNTFSGEQYENSYEPKSLPIWPTRLRPGQMRVLQIEAGALEGDISAQLHVSNIQHSGVKLEHNKQPITYDALSYSWGYVGATKEIRCNGYRITIIDSLWQALKHIRCRDEDRFVWIDALCINQVDLAEKSAQVASMLLFYSKAANVIAWLGNKNQCGNGAIDAIDRLMKETTQRLHSPACAHGLCDLYGGLRQLFSRPYFTRTWVRQEIFAAKALWVQVGCHRVPWRQFIDRGSDLFIAVPSSLQKIGSSADSENQGQIWSQNDIYQSLVLLRRGQDSGTDCIDLLASKTNFDDQSLQTLQDVSLDAALRGSDSFKATNPRDYVYGVVSMTNTNIVTAEEVLSRGPLLSYRALLVDYSRSVSQVFADTTSYLVNIHRSLDVMFLASLTHEQQTDLPSWCTDYRHLSERTLLDPIFEMMDGFSREARGYTSTNAPSIRRYRGLTPHHTPHYRHISEFFHAKAQKQTKSDGHLHCKGSLLGTISSISDSDRSWFTSSQKFIYFEHTIKPRLKKPDSRFKVSGFKLRHDINSVRLKEPTKGARCPLSSCAKMLRCTKCYVPGSAAEGDLVYQIVGTSLPAVVRRIDGDPGGRYMLIGALISEAWIWQIKKYREHLEGKSRKMKAAIEPVAAVAATARDSEAAFDLPVEEMVLV